MPDIYVFGTCVSLDCQECAFYSHSLGTCSDVMALFRSILTCDSTKSPSSHTIFHIYHIGIWLKMRAQSENDSWQRRISVSVQDKSKCSVETINLFNCYKIWSQKKLIVFLFMTMQQVSFESSCTGMGHFYPSILVIFCTT